MGQPSVIGQLSWRDIGLATFVPAVMALTAGPLALWAGEPAAARAFGLTALISIAVGWPLTRIVREPAERSPGVVLASMALAWLIVPLIGAVPFAAVDWNAGGADPPVLERCLNAAFESMSGFTSCGLTLVADPSELPASLQWWRSLSQWVGGIGIAALMLSFMNPSVDAGRLLEHEVGAAFEPVNRRVVRWVWSLYLALTALALGLFVGFGMPWWEALNHALTAASTGGFTVTADSFESYSPALQLSAAAVMALGAVSFGVYWRLATQRRFDLFRQTVTGWLLVGIAAATALVLATAHGEGAERPAPRDALFQSVSAFATGGFGTVDLSTWASAPLAVLVIGMIVGGASGSTAGGIKLDRVAIVVRATIWRIRRELGRGPEARLHVVQRERLREPDARLRAEAAATLIVIWIGALLLGAFVLGLAAEEGTTFGQSLFEATSALSSVGLTVGVARPELAPVGKLTLAALMWLGRLEVFAGFYLLFGLGTALKRTLTGRGR